MVKRKFYPKFSFEELVPYDIFAPLWDPWETCLTSRRECYVTIVVWQVKVIKAWIRS